MLLFFIYIVVGSVFYTFCVVMISSFFMENHISNTTLSSESETMMFDGYRALWCLQRCLLILDRPNIEWNLSNVRWQIKTTGAVFSCILEISEKYFLSHLVPWALVHFWPCCQPSKYFISEKWLYFASMSLPEMTIFISLQYVA